MKDQVFKLVCLTALFGSSIKVVSGMDLNRADFSLAQAPFFEEVLQTCQGITATCSINAHCCSGCCDLSGSFVSKDSILICPGILDTTGWPWWWWIAVVSIFGCCLLCCCGCIIYSCCFAKQEYKKRQLVIDGKIPPPKDKKKDNQGYGMPEIHIHVNTCSHSHDQ